MLGMMFPFDKDKKVHRLLDFTDDARDVSDPYYSGDFNSAFEDIKNGCRALYEHLKAE